MASGSECTQETLICPVCYEDYDETDNTPMVLGKCGHSICSSCLNPLTRHGRVSCPKCRVNTASRDVKVNYDLRCAAVLSRCKEKKGDEKDDCKEPGSRRNQRPPPQEMGGWLAAGAVLVGAAVFGITGYALGRNANRPRK